MLCFATAWDLYRYFQSLSADQPLDRAVFWSALQEIGRHPFNGHETANILVALARYAHALEPGTRRSSFMRDMHEGLQPWADKAYAHMSARASDPFSGGALALVLSALATLNLSLGDEFMEAWEAQAVRVMKKGRLGSGDCISIIADCNKLNRVPGRAFLDQWESAACHHIQRKRLNASALMVMINAYASLGLGKPGEDLWQEWLDTVQAHHGNGLLNDKNKGIILWSLAVIDAHQPDPYVQNLAYDILKKGVLPKSASVMDQVALAAQWFNFGSFERPDQGEWKKSVYEQRLHAALSEFNDLAVYDTAIIDDLGHCPDIALEKSGKQAFVEFDGVTHYTSAGIRGGTVLMTALMKKACPDHVIVRLPYWVYNAWNESGAYKSAVQAFADSVMRQPPGAYFYDEDGFTPMFDGLKAVLSPRL